MTFELKCNGYYVKETSRMNDYAPVNNLRVKQLAQVGASVETGSDQLEKTLEIGNCKIGTACATKRAEEAYDDGEAVSKTVQRHQYGHTYSRQCCQEVHSVCDCFGW